MIELANIRTMKVKPQMVRCFSKHFLIQFFGLLLLISYKALHIFIAIRMDCTYKCNYLLLG